MTGVEVAIAALVAGKPVVLPTDTVYGLCASAAREDSVRRLSILKGRPEAHPIALLAPGLGALLECVPELRGRSEGVCRALLPGPYTLVFRNPARRYPWLAGSRPEAIGVRVPDLPAEAAEVLGRAGCVAATSANLHGSPDPRRLEEVPDEIRAGCGAVLDGGELPGTPSTVLDLTGPEPRVVRDGAVPAREALERVRAAAG